jgi:hypothetical protein
VGDISSPPRSSLSLYTLQASLTTSLTTIWNQAHNMTGSAGYTATTANLVAMGGTSISDYLQGAFPPAPPTGDSPAAPFEFSVEALGLSDPTNSSSGTNTPTDAAEERMEEEQEAEVPFYIKVRGKGKGKPIMYDRSKSSVAQIYGKMPPLPLYSLESTLTHQSLLFD